MELKKVKVMNATKRLIIYLVAVLSVSMLACIENTAYVTQERSDKVEKYILKKEPKMKVRLNAKLENKVTLLGYDLKANDPKPGDSVEVTWYWKVHKKVGAGWRLFTHAVGKDGKLKFNSDKEGPVRKNFQPEHWQPNIIVKDHQRIKIPKDWAEDQIEIRTGVWKGNARLKGRGKHLDSNNRIRGPIIKIMKQKKDPVSMPFADTAPEIDGKFSDEAAWKGALKLDRFVNTMNGRSVPTITDVYLMWDAKHLYVAAEAKDKNLVSHYTNHDDELWKEDAFEIFLDPKGDKKDYYELQVNPKGIIFDSHLPKYRKNQNDWSSKMVAATVMDGTLNDDTDTDNGWTLELAIPFESMTEGGGVPPKSGDSWRMNFFRVDASSEKKKTYSAWSPPMRGDFHTLSRFGEVTFKGGAPEKTAVEAAPSGDKKKGASPVKNPEAKKPVKAAGKASVTPKKTKPLKKEEGKNSQDK
jgi:hypothetical protein